MKGPLPPDTRKDISRSSRACHPKAWAGFLLGVWALGSRPARWGWITSARRRPCSPPIRSSRAGNARGPATIMIVRPGGPFSRIKNSNEVRRRPADRAKFVTQTARLPA